MITDAWHLYNQDMHAARRIRQRYRYEISPETMQEFVDQIVTRQAERLRKPFAGKSVWRVHFLHKRFPVVFDHETGHIATFLPPNSDVTQPIKYRTPKRYIQIARERGQSL